MWIIVAIIAIIVVVVIKNKQSNGNDASMAQDNSTSVIQESEASNLFAENICAMLNPDGELYSWLIANSNERMVQMNCSKKGVILRKIEVNRRRYKETGTYDVDTMGYGFGASGYQDLPNENYVSAFRNYIKEQIGKKCPYVTVDNDGYIKMLESAKKGW